MKHTKFWAERTLAKVEARARKRTQEEREARKAAKEPGARPTSATAQPPTRPPTPADIVLGLVRAGQEVTGTGLASTGTVVAAAERLGLDADNARQTLLRLAGAGRLELRPAAGYETPAELEESPQLELQAGESVALAWVRELMGTGV